MNGWLLTDSSAPAKGEEAFKLPFKTVPKFALEIVYTIMSTGAATTHWRACEETPVSFNVD